MRSTGNALKSSRGCGGAAIEVPGSVQGKETVYIVNDNGVGFDMLYADKPRHVANRMTASHSPSAKAMEIPLVEDDRHDRELTVRARSKHNLANRLAWVRDGAEAIDADPRTRPIPVVVSTSSRKEADLECSYALGTNSDVVQPVEFEDFAMAIQEPGLDWLVLNEPPGHALSRGPTR